MTVSPVNAAARINAVDAIADLCQQVARLHERAEKLGPSSPAAWVCVAAAASLETRAHLLEAELAEAGAG